METSFAAWIDAKRRPRLASSAQTSDASRVLRRIPLLALPLLLTQCALWPKPELSAPKQPSYRIDQPRYASLSSRAAKLRINLTAQKAELLDRDNCVVIETDVSTGKPGHETPLGTFRVMEKIEAKRSTIYGSYLDARTRVVLGNSWEMPAPPKGAIYEGREMKFWMRLTHDGVGVHVGHVTPATATSFGCIRVPADVQPLIYAKSRIGTPVEVIAPAPTPATTRGI